jgi:hypothetical protein
MMRAAEGLDVATELHLVAVAGIRHLERRWSAGELRAHPRVIHGEVTPVIDLDPVARLACDTSDENLTRVFRIGTEHQIPEAGHRGPP